MADLTLRQKNILQRLLRRKHGATRDDILDLIYTSRNIHEPEWAHKVVHVEIHKLRRALEPRGIKIVTADRIKFGDGARYYIPIECYEKARAIVTIEMPKTDWDEFVKAEKV